MNKIGLLITLACSLYGGMAFAESCRECMSQCPHLTRDIKACDRGCPEVCSKEESAGIAKFQACSECMSGCPHQTRDFRLCDAGCPGICDPEALVMLLFQARSSLSECRETNRTELTRTPSAVSNNINKSTTDLSAIIKKVDQAPIVAGGSSRAK